MDPSNKTLMGSHNRSFSVGAIALAISYVLPSTTWAQGTTQTQRNLVVSTPSPSAAKGQRLALVIGNSAYKDAPLANPVNDAGAIAKALAEAGFHVIIKENADLRTMQSALREFGDRLRGNGGAGLFYYAGHGMQIKGRNYLIPVGATLEREDEVAYAALDAQAILDKMESAGNTTNIMILDACRNNPFTRSTRSGQAGLAQMDAPLGTLVAYATAPGSVASDGSSGTNGLYTEHLLKAMRQPGLKVEDIFKQVRAGVRRDSQGKQIPWESTSMEGDFFFTAPTPMGPTVNPQEVVENALWDAVKETRHAAELQAYIARYPKGKYIEHAKQLFATLKALQPTPAPSVPHSIAAPVGASQQLPTSTAATSPLPFLFEVGDTWRYEKFEPITNKHSSFTHKVIGVDFNTGHATVQSGTTERTVDASGQMIRRITDDRTQDYTPGCKVRIDASNPKTWVFERSICRIDTKWKNGKYEEWAGQGLIEFGGLEKITTPAGEFLAQKFVRRLENAAAKNTRREEVAYWFVDGLKNWVAQDYKAYNSDDVLRAHERIVLSEYSILNPKARNAIQSNMVEAQAWHEGTEGINLGDFAVSNSKQQVLPPVNPPVQASEPSTNAYGFSMGDRWRYQVVDKFKKEVVKNYGHKISGLLADGSILVDDGAQRWSPKGAPLVVDYNNGFRDTWENAYARYPTKLFAGATEPVKYTYHWKQPVNYGTEIWDLTMKVVKQEGVVVPAGTFRSWRVEIWGGVISTGNTGNGTGFLKQTCWFVPELLAYAACDREIRFGTKLSKYDRTELTSYTINTPGSLARAP